MKDSFSDKIFEEVYGYECIDFDGGVVWYDFLDDALVVREMYSSDSGFVRKAFKEIVEIAHRKEKKYICGIVNQEKLPWLIAFYLNMGAKITGVDGSIVGLKINLFKGIEDGW